MADYEDAVVRWKIEAIVHMGRRESANVGCHC
jgi:hypothetical protein